MVYIETITFKRFRNVQVVADASGTSTPLADNVTYERLRDMGAVITSTYGMLFELYSDLSTPDGKKAEAIASGAPKQQKAPASNETPKENKSKPALAN